MRNKKKIIITVIGLLSLVLITMGVTYAVFIYTKLGSTENVVTTGTIKFLYTENTGVGSGIQITNALPVEDSVGKSYTTEGYVFDFKIEGTNSGSEPINYEVTLRKKKDSTLGEQNAKIYLTDMTNNSDQEILVPSKYDTLIQTSLDVGDNTEKTLYQGTVAGNSTNYLKNFRLRMWIDSGSKQEEVNGKTFTVTVNVYANVNVVSNPNVYTDATLNGTDPILNEKLIPVTLSNDGTVVYADVSNKWYDYSNKEWANAIILNDGVTHKVGETIPETEIESYFVWIPRYKYQIFNEGNYTTYTGTSPSNASVSTIQIVFESKNNSVSTGLKVGEYLTHPAFTNFDVDGMWVGKFETGYDGATTTTGAEVNSNNSSKIIIKPNKYSWRNNTISNMFMSAYNYKRELNSHMMKNTEWGAVAYLSHSKYGINTEVNINNNSAFLTGYSAAEGTDQSKIPGTSGTTENITQPYNNSTGHKASTTGNITGVYDMSGGAWEYVASYVDGNIGSSGFTLNQLNTYKKYFDIYNSNSNITSYNNRILGDATGEMGPFNQYKDGDGTLRNHNSWYSDQAYFLGDPYYWFARGGYYNYGVLCGQFSFSRNTGGILSNIGSRLVLAF